MNPANLLPWTRRNNAAVRANDDSDVLALQSNLNRAFDVFWRSFNAPFASSLDSALPETMPRIDVRESDKEVVVTAELPGMDEDDVEVSVADGALTIRGEFSREREKDEDGYVLRERSLGRVERVVPLPEGLDLDSAAATLKNGLLSVTLPRNAAASAAKKKIAIKRAS